MRYILFTIAAACSLSGQQQYDLLLKGGHVIDPKNNVNGVMDVAIAKGKVARVAPNIRAADAAKTVDVAGFYVTPGLIDIHAHVFQRQKELGGSALSVQADAFSFRSGATTLVDAGSAGWREFPDFRDRIIKRSATRILAFLNIVGSGIGGGREDDPTDMDVAAAVKMAKENPDLIVGFKSAHYAGPGWESVENSVKAGKETDMPVMIDFGRLNEKRNLSTLLLDKLRPGDIYTHCYSGHREEVLPDGKLNPAMHAGRKRGIIFDIGHGAGSFYWYVAIPAYQQQFPPDSVSTDLHTGSMNAGMKDIANVMSKMLNLGSPLAEVVKMTTWNPAKQIKRPQLGNLDEGSEADVTVLKVSTGNFGFVDSAGARDNGTQFIECEMTLRAGKVVWDRNGRGSVDWKKFPYKKEAWRQ
jgi:dihydroorotase